MLSCNERNEVTLRRDRDGSVVVKRFRLSSQWEREVRAYKYVHITKSLPVPRLLRVLHKRIELQFLRGVGDIALKSVVDHARDFHLASLRGQMTPETFLVHDLSREKVLHRIGYIAKEASDRGIVDRDLINSLKRFALRDYDPSGVRTLVHGDIKTPHLFQTDAGLRFIDLGEVAWASPWYDQVFLLLEREPICGSIGELADVAADAYGTLLGLTQEEVGVYLKSALVYRALYNFGYALRHRPAKTIRRTWKELWHSVECSANAPWPHLR